MANRRMFSKEIISSDAFMTMGLGSQALYYTLGMNADDDGVVNNPKIIQRSIGANDDDMRVLIAKRFVIPIDEAGIVVIKHWKINNLIQKDRYTPSKYLKDLSMLGLDENGAYKLMDTTCIQNGYRVETQDSIGKYSIDKDSIDKVNKEKIIKKEKPKFEKPTLEEVTKYVIENEKNVNPDMFFNYYETNGWKVGKNPMKSWKSAIALWACKANENNIDYVSKRKQEHPSNELTKVDQELLDLLADETNEIEEDTPVTSTEEVVKFLNEHNVVLDEYFSAFEYAASYGSNWKSALAFAYGFKL